MSESYLRYREEKDAYEAAVQERENDYTINMLPAFEQAQRVYHRFSPCTAFSLHTPTIQLPLITT